MTGRPSFWRVPRNRDEPWDEPLTIQQQQQHQPAASRTITEIMLSPVENLPVTVFPGQASNQQQSKDQQKRNINYELFPFLAEEKEMDRDRERIVVTHQPYRTTPLVLPGAKVGRDTSNTTQCYLALQQNQPLLWQSAPAHQPSAQQQQSATDALLKQKIAGDIKTFDPSKGWSLDHQDEQATEQQQQQQQLEAAAAMVQRNLAMSAAGGARVAVSHEAGDAPPPKQEVVHKQFNSPLGLYSSENVQEALALQSGIIPPNNNNQQQQQGQPRPHLDLKYSETLRALNEENSKKQSHQSVDARGLKQVHHAPSAPIKTVASNPHFKVNVMGVEKEKIQQSYSFKRLMADVLGETDF